MVDKTHTKNIAGCSPNESFVYLSNVSVSRELHWGTAVQLHPFHAAVYWESQKQGTNTSWKAFNNGGKEDHTSSH